jgi:transposase-like protein
MSDRDLLKRQVVCGETYVTVSRRFGVSISTAWRWCQDVQPPIKRLRRLTPAERAKIRLDIDMGELSLRGIARKHRVHHSTVSTIRDRATVGGFAKKPHRCGHCHALITTRVCIRCATSPNFR